MSTSTCHSNWFSYVCITRVLKVYYIIRHYIMNKNIGIENVWRFKCLLALLANKEACWSTIVFLALTLVHTGNISTYVCIWKLIAFIVMKVYSLNVQLRLRDTHELLSWALIFIVFKSSILVVCIKWSRHRLQSTV